MRHVRRHAEVAASRKKGEYGLWVMSSLNRYSVETLDVFNSSARHLLNDFGRGISHYSGEAKEEEEEEDFRMHSMSVARELITFAAL